MRAPLSNVIPAKAGIQKTIISLILIAFIISTFGPLPAQANEFYLPKPGVMVHLSPEFNPPVLKGLKVHPDNPFKFDFILDQGDSKMSSSQEQLKTDANRLIKYFLASLTIPEKDLWVNLSPYEKDRIVPESFGQTEMGRDLLAQDYLLKQITASLIYPEDEIGKKFWNRIYAEAEKKFHTTNISVNTFNKVWIVPEKAVVYESPKAGTAYVVESKLKVMLEEDYLALGKNSGDTSVLGPQILREIIIPELTKEINQGKNFAQLRQVYQSLILATWYKKKIKDSILSKVYADRNKVAGVTYSSLRGGEADAAISTQHIYQQYLQAFKKGVYNYIKEEQDPATQQSIPRKYFSGGMSLAMTSLNADNAMTITHKAPDASLSSAAMVSVNLVDATQRDKAMNGGTTLLEGEVLNLDQRFISKRENIIGAGGEGVVYRVPKDNKVIKIYFAYHWQNLDKSIGLLDQLFVEFYKDPLLQSVLVPIRIKRVNINNKETWGFIYPYQEGRNLDDVLKEVDDSTKKRLSTQAQKVLTRINMISKKVLGKEARLADGVAYRIGTEAFFRNFIANRGADHQYQLAMIDPINITDFFRICQLGRFDRFEQQIEAMEKIDLELATMLRYILEFISDDSEELLRFHTISEIFDYFTGLNGTIVEWNVNSQAIELSHFLDVVWSVPVPKGIKGSRSKSALLKILKGMVKTLESQALQEKTKNSAQIAEVMKPAGKKLKGGGVVWANKKGQGLAEALGESDINVAAHVFDHATQRWSGAVIKTSVVEYLQEVYAKEPEESIVNAALYDQLIALTKIPDQQLFKRWEAVIKADDILGSASVGISTLLEKLSQTSMADSPDLTQEQGQQAIWDDVVSQNIQMYEKYIIIPAETKGGISPKQAEPFLLLHEILRRWWKVGGVGDQAMNATDKQVMTRVALIEVIRNLGWDWYESLLSSRQMVMFDDRVRALAEIAKEIPQQESIVEEAKAVINQRSRADDIESARSGLVEILANYGRVIEAKFVLDQISKEDSYERVWAWSKLIEATAGREGVEEVKSEFELIEHIYTRSSVQQVVVEALAGCQKIEEAKAITENISDPYWRSLAWIEIAKATLGKEGIEEAISAGKKISRSEMLAERGLAWIAIIGVLAQSGRMEEAKIAMGQIPGDYLQRTLAWSEIIKATKGKEGLREAKSLVKLMNSYKRSATAWTRIAEVTEGKEGIEEAKLAAKQILDDDNLSDLEREAIWLEIVKVLADLGRIDEAKSTIGQMREADERTLAWIAVAKAQQKMLSQRYHAYEENILIPEFSSIPTWGILEQQELKLLLAHHKELMQDAVGFNKVVKICKTSKDLIDLIDKLSESLGNGDVSEVLYESWVKSIAEMALEFYSRDASDRWHGIVERFFQDGRYQPVAYQTAVGLHQERLGRPSYHVAVKGYPNPIINVRWGVLVKEVSEEQWQQEEDRFEVTEAQEKESHRRQIPLAILVKSSKEVDTKFGLLSGKIVWKDKEEPIYLLPQEHQPRRLNGHVVRVLGFSPGYTRVFYIWQGEIVSMCLYNSFSKKRLAEWFDKEGQKQANKTRMKIEQLIKAEGKGHDYEIDGNNGIAYRLSQDQLLALAEDSQWGVDWLINKQKELRLKQKSLDANQIYEELSHLFNIAGLIESGQVEDAVTYKAIIDAPRGIEGHYEGLDVLSNLIREGKMKPDKAMQVKDEEFLKASAQEFAKENGDSAQINKVNQAMNSVPLPKQAAEIDTTGLYQWVEQGSSEILRGIRRKIVNHLINEGYVSQTKFEASLRETVVDLNAFLQQTNEPYAVLFDRSQHKSKRWVFSIAEKVLNKRPIDMFFTADADILIRAGIRNIVIFDDGAYSGQQLKAVISGFLGRDELKVKPKIILAIPYMTDIAIEQVRELAKEEDIEVFILKHKRIKVVKDLLTDSERKFLEETRLRFGEEVKLKLSCTFFDFKIPDDRSFYVQLNKFIKVSPTPYSPSNQDENARGYFGRERFDHYLDNVMSESSSFFETLLQINKDSFYAQERIKQRQRVMDLIQDSFRLDFKKRFLSYASAAMTVGAIDHFKFGAGSLRTNKTGGIDLTSDKTLEVKMDSRVRGNDREGIKFDIDPAMLEQLQNAQGFTPIIINIQPMNDLRLFLGIREPAKEQLQSV